MSNGFLGFDTSFMLDFVVCALVLVVPVLACSIFAVKFRRIYVLHRNLQLALAVILLLAVSAFEIDMRMHGGWKNIVNKDPAQPRLTGDALETVRTALYVHMCFAITTPLLWGVTIALALKRFPNPPQPGEHSRLHKTLGWLSTIDITMTSVTGLVFYYLAFVA